MSWQQVKTPNIGVPCRPGWCLQYVQNAFDALWAGLTATDGWNQAQFKHADDKFPDGVAVPVWFAMKGEPAGHVAVRMADGSYYSTSHPTNKTAYHHPNLQHLLTYYGGRLTLRGWSEDLNGMRVIAKGENMAVSDAELADLRKWKEIGQDAQQWKAALEASALWPLLQGDHKKVGDVAKDLVAWKEKGLKLEQEQMAQYELVPYEVYRKK